MKKKELYKVGVNNQNTAHSFKHALIAIGENVCHEYFDVYEKEMVLIFSVGDDEWMLVNKTHSAIGKRKFIEFKELISFLVYNVKSKSILDGKVAIQVNNEREFELLMKHYEEKGWQTGSTEKYRYSQGFNCYDYHDLFRRSNIETQISLGYTIIPFADFAKEVGIEVPVFIMKSEDGIDLYEGDQCFVPQVCIEKPYEDDPLQLKAVKTWPKNGENNNYFFISKKAAEKWIEEKNKPKEVEVEMFSEHNKCIVNKFVEITNDKLGTLVLTYSDIEDIIQAIQQLKGGDNA